MTRSVLKSVSAIDAENDWNGDTQLGAVDAPLKMIRRQSAAASSLKLQKRSLPSVFLTCPVPLHADSLRASYPKRRISKCLRCDPHQ